MAVHRKPGEVSGPEVVFEAAVQEAVQEIGRRDHLLPDGNFSWF